MERQYKDSGIEWIGRIPENWKVLPHKRLMRKRKELCAKYGGEDIISLTTNGVIVRDLTAGGKMPTTFDGYQFLYPGNLLMCLFDIDVTPRCVGYVKNEGLTSPAYSRFEMADGAYGPYYDYLLRYMDDEKCLLHLSKNLRSSLTEEDFGQIHSILPSYMEQQRIADFLDEKCGEIDSLIGLQELMIEKLKAYKQSVITEAVTKGLNPNAKLVPSGIDWIGEIPEGWRITVLRRFANIILGKMLQPNAKFKEDTLEQYICAKDVHFEGIDISDLKKMYFNKLEKEMYQVQKGDMLVVEGGAGAAGSCVLKSDLPNTYIQNSIMIVRPKHGIDIRFIQYYEFSLVKKGYVDYVCNKATIPHFTKDKLSSMPIPLPPLSEQQAIASYLDGKCSEIDKLIAVKQQKIEKLKDYKKSVIYEAVTGKTIV